MRRTVVGHILVLVAVLAGPVRGEWFDDSWPWRRAVDVTWDAEHASGREIAAIRFYTAGHHLPDGSDIRIATEAGRLVPFEVLKVGPGDQVSVAFALQKGIKSYFVYFGRKDPPPLPRDLPAFRPTAGLLMETRRWNRQNANNFKQIEQAFAASSPVLGKAMVERPFIGYNPASDEPQTISKLTGSLFAPIDGPYFFAIAGDDRAGLWIDGQPVAFASWAAGDARFNGRVELKRGHHDIVIYHMDQGGEWRLSVGWQRPDMARLEILDRSAVGFFFGGMIGTLEPRAKRLIADFSAEYMGECYFDDDYAHRYRFSAPEIRGVECEWDFGDGQKARGVRVEHVYLTGGVFPLKLTAKAKVSSDTQTTRLHVTRDLTRPDKPKTVALDAVSTLVKEYDLKAASGGQLARMVALHRRAGDRDAMLAAATALARTRRHADARRSLEALGEAVSDAVAHGRAAEAMSMLEQVPRDSNLQPRAAEMLGEHLLWWVADPRRAVAALEPYVGRSDGVKRLHGQALVLAGEPKKGRAVLESLPIEGEMQKRAALGGAMARTVEFFIGEKEWEAGEEQWQQWMRRFPADFLDGYSVLLRAKLMELRGAKAEAAKIAEAFAASVPASSYAPRLLHFAAELLKDSDKPKSDALRQLLKQRYPEDPLSQ